MSPNGKSIFRRRDFANECNWGGTQARKKWLAFFCRLTEIQVILSLALAYCYFHFQNQKSVVCLKFSIHIQRIQMPEHCFLIRVTFPLATLRDLPASRSNTLKNSHNKSHIDIWRVMSCDLMLQGLGGFQGPSLLLAMHHMRNNIPNQSLNQGSMELKIPTLPFKPVPNVPIY